MDIIFEKIRSMLVGKKSCYIKESYGGGLKIGLGEEIFFKDVRLKGRFHGECEVLSRFCTWRILQENKVICGYENDYELNGKALLSLQTGILLEIIQKSAYDIAFVFKNNIVVDFINNSIDEPLLIILGNDNKVFELTQKGWTETNSDENAEKMTELDGILAEHSKMCIDRWATGMQENNTDYECNECFYFRSISGYFYFWDLGICSNKDSIYDAKIVGVKSGCVQFKKLKDLMFEKGIRGTADN